MYIKLAIYLALMYFKLQKLKRFCLPVVGGSSTVGLMSWAAVWCLPFCSNVEDTGGWYPESLSISAEIFSTNYAYSFPLNWTLKPYRAENRNTGRLDLTIDAHPCLRTIKDIVKHNQLKYCAHKTMAPKTLLINY